MEKIYQKDRTQMSSVAPTGMLRILSLPSLDYLWLSLIILLTYAIFLVAHPLLVPVEARYSEVAREMLVNHQFITPQVNGIDFFDKPILFYWLQAIAMAVFGVNAWAIRLWPMLFGLFGVLIIFSTCKHLFNRRAAWVMAMMLASSPLYYFTAHYANLDLEVAVLITASLCFFIRAYQHETNTFSAKWLYASYAAAGLAILTKGLIGIAFPIMIIGLWILFTNQWSLLRQTRIAHGLGLILLITLPWFIAVEYVNPGFSYYFFYVQQFLRFLTASFNNREPFWFYLPVVLVGILPWSLYLFMAFKNYIKQKNVISTFFVIWAATIFVFFSIPHSKLIGYIVPAIPPLAVLAGQAYLAAEEKTKKLIANIYMVILELVLIGIWLIPAHLSYFIGFTLTLKLIYSVAFVLLLALLGYISYAKPRFIFASLVTINFILFNLVLASYLLIKPIALTHFFPVKELTHQIKPFMQPNDDIISYFDYYQDLPMYTGKQVLMVHHWDKPNLANHDNWRGEFAYAAKYLQPEAKDILLSPEQFNQLWNTKQRLFVFLPVRYLIVLEEAVSPSVVCIIGQANKIMVVTNDNQICHTSLTH
ncbi:MAG: ArnT family glycosyltransferase [Gammaproteobacteria bacterium]